MRVISGLITASQLDERPDCIPRARSRGKQALGHRYEEAVARQLGPKATQGIWWSFRDRHGPGLCQTDLLMRGQNCSLVIEVKHTWTDEGMAQLKYLYLPVVSKALGQEIIGIQVCKHLVPYARGKIAQTFEEAVRLAYKNNSLVTVHWRGIGPLLQSQMESASV